MHRCAQQSCRARAAPRPRRVPGPKHSAAEELLSPVRHVAHVRRRSFNGIAAVKRVVRPPAQAAACRTRRLARPATGLRPRRRARRTKRVPGGASSQAEAKIVKHYISARHPPLHLAHLRYRARKPMRGEGAAPAALSSAQLKALTLCRKIDLCGWPHRGLHFPKSVVSLPDRSRCMHGEMRSTVES